MASIGNPAWSTTFFYAQDLRSLYMNGLLANIVKPGIYNPNMAVFAKDTSTDSASNPGGNHSILKDTPQGLYLYIKKGTTFIFSNNYRYTSSKDVIRDMKSTGSFIIKSTTLDDTYLPIDITGSASSKMLFGQETTNSQVDYKAEKEIYLYAIINYSGEADLNVPNIPQIQWCTKNLEYSTSTAGIRYMFNNQIGGDKFRIPDGKGTFNDSTSQTCYLFLGTLTRKKTATTLKYLGASGDWITKGGEKFIEDYIFTGRGFPEYRQTSEQFSSVFKPDFTFSHNTFLPTTRTTTETVPDYYLSAESMSLGSNVFSTDKGYDWRGYFGIVSGTLPKSAKFTFHDWSSLPAPSSNTEPNELLITDLVYLSVHNRTSEETTEELLGSLLKTNNTEVPTIESFSWVTYGKDSDENKIPQIFNPNQFDIQALNPESETVFNSEPWDETHNKVNISFSPNAYHSKLETPKHTTTTSASYILSGVPTINLDTNVSNIERLASIIENKNVVPTVIEYIRRHRSEDNNNNIAKNHMDASQCSSIIPVALAFRKFKKVGTEWKSIDSVSTLKGTVHPSNILNFFDLQSSAMKVFDVSIETSDVYTILPVID